MNIKIITRAIALCVILVSTQYTVSSQSKNAVVLINSVPYNVVLSAEGEISTIKGEAKNYMRGFKKSKEEFITPKAIVKADLEKGATVRRERNMLSFENGMATMDNALNIQLDKIAASFNSNSEEKILISAFKGNETEPSILSKNRIASIKTYLALKGIPNNKVSSEVVVSSSLKDKVSITYIK